MAEARRAYTPPEVSALLLDHTRDEIREEVRQMVALQIEHFFEDVDEEVLKIQKRLQLITKVEPADIRAVDLVVGEELARQMAVEDGWEDWCQGDDGERYDV